MKISTKSMSPRFVSKPALPTELASTGGLGLHE